MSVFVRTTGAIRNNNVNAGKLREIPEISVDGFTEDSENQFLTHPHKDHTNGFHLCSLRERLRGYRTKLYCHPLTKALIEDYFIEGGQSDLLPLIQIINEFHKIYIKIIRDRGAAITVTVTALPAGHCPGSLMFLFETPNQRILYSGDCRLSIHEWRNLHPLYDDVTGELKEIDVFYADTTFCLSMATSFPDRELILEESLTNVAKYSSFKIFAIVCAAFIPHVEILLKIYEKFMQKIYVRCKEHYKLCSKIPELQEIITEDEKCTKFHLYKREKDVCDDFPNVNNRLLILKYSSFWYAKRGNGREIRFSLNTDNKKWTLNVCYSMHPSSKELAESIGFLKPKKVVPLVMAEDVTSSEMESALRSMIETDFVYEDYQPAAITAAADLILLQKNQI